jgi:hypothetical protein
VSGPLLRLLRSRVNAQHPVQWQVWEIPLNYAAYDRQDKVYPGAFSRTDTDYGNWNTKRPVFLILVSTTLYAELYLSISRKWSQKNDYLGVQFKLHFSAVFL